MTNEEAVLTLKVVEEYFDKNVPVLGGEAMRMAIDALRAQQAITKLDRNKWQEKCEWCKDFTGRIRPDFCFSCGKPQTEKAWAELERRIGECNGTTAMERLQ